jgi:putative membrane protein insertion efficiency factor
VNLISIFVRMLVGESAGQSVCRFHPSCSRYAGDAVRKYGPFRGALKAAWRVLRCNPWSHGGVDYA